MLRRVFLARPARASSLSRALMVSGVMASKVSMPAAAQGLLRRRKVRR
jgi:hypothetical protein